MAKRKRTDNTMVKRKKADNTMAKRKRADNTMAKRKRTDNTMAKKKEQTTPWPKGTVQNDKQRSKKHTYKTKDRVTRTPLRVCIQSEG